MLEDDFTVALLAGWVALLAGVADSLEIAELLLVGITASLDIATGTNAEEDSTSDASAEIPGMLIVFSSAPETESSEPHYVRERPMARVKQKAPEYRIHTPKEILIRSNISYFSLCCQYFTSLQKNILVLCDQPQLFGFLEFALVVN